MKISLSTLWLGSFTAVLAVGFVTTYEFDPEKRAANAAEADYRANLKFKAPIQVASDTDPRNLVDCFEKSIGSMRYHLRRTTIAKLKDPKSFEVIGYYKVTGKNKIGMKFRAKNGYGSHVVEHSQANVVYSKQNRKCSISNIKTF